MKTVIIVFLAALGVTAASTALLQRTAEWLGFVDNPTQQKMHARPAPLMGGLAILGGVTITFLVFVGEFSLSRRVIGVLFAGIVMSCIGLIDDYLELRAWTKLVGQLIGVLILIYFDVRVMLPLPEVVNYIITVLWVVGISNAINFVDNMDGLCAGMSGVAAAFIVLIAAIHDQGLVAALGAAVCGACVGFLRYNFAPAKIFMGDTGSLFLGFVLAILGILLRFPDNVTFVTWMVPILILGLPLLDMALVVISRVRRGVNPFTTAGKDHISHRLMALGFSQREAVLILYLVAVVFGVVGMFVAQADVSEGYTIGAIMAGLCVYTIWWLEKQPIQIGLGGKTS